jgi:hypothetical protein
MNKCLFGRYVYAYILTYVWKLSWKNTYVFIYYVSSVHPWFCTILYPEEKLKSQAFDDRFKSFERLQTWNDNPILAKSQCTTVLIFHSLTNDAIQRLAFRLMLIQRVSASSNNASPWMLSPIDEGCWIIIIHFIVFFNIDAYNLVVVFGAYCKTINDMFWFLR